ncbi:MAG: hypothetical protein WAN20_08800 [Pseudonocardiaceae bacterium]
MGGSPEDSVGLLRRDAAARATGDVEAARAAWPGRHMVDRRAVSAYRHRLTELEEDLSEAESWADQARAAMRKTERDALLDQLMTATGLHGRQRRTSSAGERARVAVRKAVAAAIDRIDQLDPALGRLLRDTVRTGTVCRYDPDPTRPVRWLLDEPDRGSTR